MRTSFLHIVTQASVLCVAGPAFAADYYAGGRNFSGLRTTFYNGWYNMPQRGNYDIEGKITARCVGDHSS